MAGHVVVSKIEQGKLVVTQANKLIEASYTMSLEEKRIVLLMVSLVRQEDKDFHTYRIPITDIRDYLNLHTNKLYDDIKRVADALLSRVLHIPEEDGGWLKVGWVASARYVPKGRKEAEVACLDLSFSPEMKPYLLELKAHFANYMLQNVASLRSFYSIRMYELLKSRRRLQTTAFDVAALRKILRTEDKYRNYKDFRARVILPAQAELAEKTDIAFEFEETRKGCNKVVSVTFRIRDNVPTKPPRSITGAAKVTPRLTAPGPEQPPLLPPTEADRERMRLYAEAIAEGAQNGIRESAIRLRRRVLRSGGTVTVGEPWLDSYQEQKAREGQPERRKGGLTRCESPVSRPWRTRNALSFDAPPSRPFTPSHREGVKGGRAVRVPGSAEVGAGRGGNTTGRDGLMVATTKV